MKYYAIADSHHSTGKIVLTKTRSWKPIGSSLAESFSNPEEALKIARLSSFKLTPGVVDEAQYKKLVSDSFYGL